MDLTRIARGGTPIDLDRTRVLFFDKAATWLLVQRYGTAFLAALYAPGKNGAVELQSMDVLAFFLWAGLQAQARELGEDLTPERVEEFIVPLKIGEILNKVIIALARGIQTPPEPGKAEAVPASPAGAAEAPAARHPRGPGPTRASTLQTRSASQRRSSAKRPTTSGTRR